MKHAPESYLRKLQYGYIAFAALVLMSYAVSSLLPDFALMQSIAGVSEIAALCAAATILYGLIGTRFLFRDSVWLRYFTTYILAIIVALFSTTTTGEYTSYFMYAIGIISFFGGFLGIYAAAVPFAVHIAGLVFIPLGIVQVQSNNMEIGAAILICWTLSAAGWYYWRRTYSKDEESDGIIGDLRDEKQKSEIILNAIEDGVILVDGAGIIQLFNPGAAKITGWSIKEAVGLQFNSVMKLVNEHDEAYNEMQNPFSMARQGGQTVRDNNCVLVSRSDKRIPISLIVSPLLGEDEEVDWTVGIFRDITKEKYEERQRAEFISTASHEMRTPVAAIEGYLALAMNDKVSTIDKRALSYLEKAHANTQHLGKLFQDLLTSAKAEDGRLVNHPEVVEMGAFLEQLTDSLRFAAEKKGLLTEFTLGTTDSSGTSVKGDRVVRPLYYIYADPERLREVITNLFDNAVKYTETGKISFGLTGNDSIVQFFIKDTGEGIPAEDLPHLFQKFYRVDSSATRVIGGTGLGLFISRKILEMYNGRIWVDSKLGEGSTFYINVPRLSTQKAESLKASQPSAIRL